MFHYLYENLTQLETEDQKLTFIQENLIDKNRIKQLIVNIFKIKIKTDVNLAEKRAIDFLKKVIVEKLTDTSTINSFKKLI